MNKEERIEYLEDERKKIWEKLLVLEELVKSKTSDYEEAAKLASEDAVLHSTTVAEKLAEVLLLAQNISEKNSSINTSYEGIIEIAKEAQIHLADSKSTFETIDDILTKSNDRNKEIETTAKALEVILSKKAELEKKVFEIESAYEKALDIDNKISLIYKSITDIKKDIDRVNIEIFGFTSIDSLGNDANVEGLKDKLESSFDELSTTISTSRKELVEYIETSKTNLITVTQNGETSFIDKIDEWKQKFEGIEKEITNLLPKAMTAGLSFAYSDKKQEEVKELESQGKVFRNGIYGLIAVSLIPFLFSISSLITGTAIEIVILRIPRVALSILPIYIPVLWVAYSANRKMNLSKRLIEEYTHKEVLSKTFEGLSKQISNIDDRNISEDLRIKLLYNILEVNSENPGKLISDYNKSDHPLMDALDKSIKLTNVVTKLAQTPGMQKLAQTLTKKADRILKEQDEKAKEGFEMIEDEEETKG